MRVFNTFLLLGEVGAALVTLSFAFTLFSGIGLWTLSEDESSAVLPLLTSDESFLDGWLVPFSAPLSSSVFGLSSFFLVLSSFFLSISKLFFSETEDLVHRSPETIAFWADLVKLD